ncbi:MAG: RICIN domain-containing protein [Clostridia bacterium]|nr:RICIN domain-containing protein [Clostridia bacterium]
MQKVYFYLKKNIVGIILLLCSITCLFLYTKINSFSIATEQKTVDAELSLSNYVNYNENWGKGSLLQYNLKTGIEQSEEQEQPKIKETKVEINTPQINGIYPENVKVISKSTMFTNGDNNKNLVEYTYNKNTGIIDINIKNIDENGNIINGTTNYNAKDEFEIISNYSEVAYSGTNEERNLKFKINIKQELFKENNFDQNTITNNKEFEIKLSENVGSVTSVKQTADSVYNGYIKSNIINGTDYTTYFKEYEEIQLGNSNAQQQITLQENTDKAKYRATIINKDDIKNMLGEEGKIEVLDADGNIIGTVSKDNDTVVYDTQLSTISIKTSNIENEGILRFENIKEVANKTEIIDNIKTVKQLTGIKNGSEVVYTKQQEDNTEVKDSQTKIEVSTNLEEWTNEKQNEVEFNIKLDSNGSQYNLFKNPTINIELPSEVEKVILGESSLIYGGELQINNINLGRNDNGNYVITASLSGEQKGYNENDLGLVATLKIPATVILNKDLNTEKANLNIAYSNEYVQDTGSYSREISIKDFQESIEINEQNNEEILPVNNEESQTAKQMLMQSVEKTANVLANVTADDIKLEVTPYKGEKKLNNGDTIYEGEFVKYDIKITNNTDHDIENVKLVATIPEGVTYGELESNFYDENGKYEYNFNSELRNKEFEIGRVEANKTYVGYIEVKANDLNDDETEKQIESNIKINVQNSEVTSYSQSNVIKNAEAKIFVKAVPTPEKDNWEYKFIVEGNEEANIEVKLPEQFEFDSILKSEIDENTGEFIGNKWSTDSYNLDGNILTTTVPQGTYVIYGKINSAIFNDFDTSINGVELYTYATATVNNIAYSSNENRIKVKHEEVNISIESDNEGEKVEYGEEINYKITIKNVGGMSKTRPVYINLKDYLPDNIEYSEITYEDWESEKDNIIYGENDEIISYTTTGKFNKVEKTENIYLYDDDDGNKYYKIDYNLCIPYGETSVIKVKGYAGDVEEETKIENYATVSDINANNVGNIALKTKTSNIITHYVQPLVPNEIPLPESDDSGEDSDEPITPDNPDDKQNQESDIKYIINGKAWIDDNKNGRRDEGEIPINGITASLVDMKNSSVVKEKTTTNSEGTYSFSNLEQGNYIILFDYDTQNYSVTSYRKSGVSDELNSDAQASTVTINGEQRLAGITDVISLNRDYYNIDLGLISNTNVSANIKLDKYISKVTLQTNKRTKEKNYENAKLAKTEIRAKEIEGATVNVEYKIVITNVGQGTSKIGTIVDTIPQGFSLIGQGSSNWVRRNNDAINSSLANKELKANESVQLTFTLSKTMSANETGTYTNIAKINGQNTIGDNNKADLIISISTGAIIVYTLAIMGVLLCLFVGIVLVKKYGISFIAKSSLLLIVAFLLANPTNMVKGKITADQMTKEDRAFIESISGGHRYELIWDEYVIKPNDYPVSPGEPRSRVPFGEKWVGAFGDWTWAVNPDGDFWSWWLGYKKEKLNRPEDSVGKAAEGNRNTRCIQPEAGSGLGKWIWKSLGAMKDWELDGELEDPKTYSDDVKHNLINKNKEENINSNIINNETIYGPFKFTCSKAVDYTVNAYDHKGNKIQNITLCDSEGKALKLDGEYNETKTFYIKIPQDVLPRGLKKVELHTIKRGKETKIKYKFAHFKYYSETTQNARTLDAYPFLAIFIDNDISDEHSIYWTNITGSLKIIKQDADDENIKLPGVKVNIVQCKYDSSKWVQDKDLGTFTTDENGEIRLENLPADTWYLIKEIENPIYGYENSKYTETDNKGTYTWYCIRSGMTHVMSLPNSKETGNLKIQKVDKDSREKLEGIGFKLKDSNGKYVIAYTDDSESGQAKVEGKKYLTKIETTDNKDSATEFITDKNGEIEIYNILAGTYTIEETSLGNNNGYDIDDESVAWEHSDGTTSNGINAQVTVVKQKSYNTVQQSSIITDDQKTIEDGTYAIESALSSEKAKVLDIKDELPSDGAWVTKGDSITNYEYSGANVILNGRDKGHVSQQFYIKYEGNGYYTLRNMATNKMVDIDITYRKDYNNSKYIRTSANVHLWSKSDSNLQRWKIEKQGDYYRFKSKSQGLTTDNKLVDLCIDVRNRKTDNGTNIQVYTALDSFNGQQFKFNDYTKYKATDNLTTLVVTNQKRFVNISGFVWKDTKGGKNDSEYTGAGIYYNKEDTPVEKRDVRLKDIKVYLKDSTGNTVNETTTDENGEYKFENMFISELPNYHVEFEYDGLKYTSVKEKVGDNDKINSKATEIVENRKALNNKFAEITNQGDIEKRDSGFSRDSNGNVTGNLGYELSNHIATLKSTTTNTNVLAATGDSYKLVDLYNDYKNNQYKDIHFKEENGSVELINVNLGIKERAMPEISILEEVYSAGVKIGNEVPHPYKYDQKPTEDDNSFNVAVKFGDNNWPGEYTRAIYPSDIKESATLGRTDENKKLKVYVTYKTVISNRSNTGTVSMSVNELVNYHDNRYQIVESWIDDGNNTAINWNEAGKYGQRYNNNGLVGVYTQSLGERKLQPEEKITLYTTYEVNDEAVLGLLNQNATLDSTTEINAYSSYYIAADEGCAENDRYAAVDNASAPGNATPNNKDTFEADTDSAPSLILEAKGVRTIEGTVFEDETTVENGERKGDGIYDVSKENKVIGVTVELIDANTGNVATVYPPEGDIKARDGIEAKKTTTDDNGHYTFSGVEPGTYYIKYTYKNGDTKLVDINNNELEDKVTVQDYKSTIITSDTIRKAFDNNERNNESNLGWYKENETRYSKARDNYNTRQAIDEGKAIDSLDATTPSFKLGIEYETTYTDGLTNYTYTVANIDFGIAKRPKQSIELKKPVKHIKVTLPDEQILIDSDINVDNVPKYVTITNGRIYITIDNELIYGSKIEIDYDVTVKNNSEIDYDDPGYYYYGDKPANNQTKPAVFKNITIADYVDKNVLYAEKDKTWNVITNKQGLEDIGLETDVADGLLKNFSTIATTNIENLAIGKDATKSISVERILSSADDLEFYNNVEVVKVEKEGGSQRLSETPANYAGRLLDGKKANSTKFNADPEEPDEAKADAVSIIPPTGDTSHIIIYTIIGMISLVILGSGIFGVKRFLKK